MFFTFFKREVMSGLKRPMIYIFMFIVALLVFFAVVSDNVMIGGAVGDVHKNAPAVVGVFVSVLNIFGLLFATAFFNNAALRDYQYQFSEILFSTPLSKAGYFFGRFMGAWLLSTLVMVGVYLGMVVGGFLAPIFDWLGPERLGPTPWGAFFSSYFLFVVPNMFFAGTIIFLLATRFKSTIISFVGTLLIIVGYIISVNLTSDIENQATAALVDVFGYSAYNLDTQYFTPAERNVMGPAFGGHLLTNRMLWMGIGLVILALSYFGFSFATKATKQKKAKKDKATTIEKKIIYRPLVPENIEDISGWATFVSFFKINFLSMFKSTTFVILLLFSLILLISNLWGGFEYFGLKSYPVTYKMLDEVNNLSSLFVLIILVFFSGELVWRDRDNHINEVIDGTPHRSVISLVAKTLSLVSLGCILHLTLMVVAILYQAFNGYTNFELNVYLQDFLTGAFLVYLTWGGILIFLQVVINNKYIGYFASVVLLFMLDIIYLVLKIETNMLNIGGTPSTMYSDMNAFGPGVTGSFWFNGYWVLFGILTVILAALLWPRGTSTTLKDRLGAGRKALGKRYYGALGFFSIAFVIVAGFVYYNTQVLNPYKTSHERELLQVSYEKQYRKYVDAPKISVLDAKYFIDIYPNVRAAKGRVEMLVSNKTDQVIDSLFFTISEDYQQSVDIPNSRLVYEDKDLGFLIYELSKPLQPSDSMEMIAHFDYTSKGFENEVSNMSVLKNGTFFNNGDILPTLGYEVNAELSDKNKRRKYDLPERQRMPDLQENCTHLCMNNYLTNGSSDWMTVETFISTSEDQIAIAPGSLLSKEVKDGRVNYHYKVDHPSLNFYSFISADYQVATRKWQGIDLEVYYHPDHSINVERMLDALQKSMKYYTENFGPYYHKQARIIEFPRYATFAQAFPGTMPYSEAFGFIINLEDEDKNNVVDAVIAHEMAHQYWAHQVIGANMKGSTMLSESFAEYSSLMVMKQESDEVQMKDFLKYDMQRYLRGRSSESEQEQPLMKVENQGHIHYGKGSVILYALQDYIGEDKVNAALRGFLEEFRYQEPPYPTAYDFMRYLEPQVPDSLQYLITDWFEDITLYDLRMEDATAKAVDNGKYEVTVQFLAKKLKADGAGNSNEAKLNDWIDIGFYADREEEELIMRQRVYLTQEKGELTFTLDELPAKAAIDPLRLLIDRIDEDNVKTVAVE
jgi:ABC-type transport system involved in multi-copper enzyme maturation permease subunit